MVFREFALAALVCAFVGACIFGVGAARAATISPLGAAGYSALPEPQRVKLKGGEFQIGSNWRLLSDQNIGDKSVAVESLVEDLAARHGIRLSGTDGPAIQLTIAAGAVAIGEALDKDKDALAQQAYRIELDERGIHITANADAGLFYGVETLIQLIKHRDGALWLPAGEIVDWPDLQIRQLYWDDAHHLDRMDALKRAIRQAAFFKINGFVIKLEGHFEFRHAPAVVEPQALTPAELQELTDYGLRFHVQLIPYLDAPGHIAFILKHPEYAALRTFPDNNYELCVANPQSYELLFGMYQDLLDANKGVKYFYLSTDEPYYVGMADDPKFSEAARLKELGSPGKVLAEFITKAAGYLHGRGRTVVFWGEHPMKPADVPALPTYLVNGEINSPEFTAAFQEHGIRHMIYVPTQGEEKLFPDYFISPVSSRLHSKDGAQAGKPRVAFGIETVATNPVRRNTDIFGMSVAAWADSGLHTETFWLGYATIAAAGWNPGATEADEASADFYALFYGPSAQNMDRVYQLMSFQAQFWADSWETGPSNAHKGIWGNSSSKFDTRRPAQDQSIPLPAIPAGDMLTADANWSRDNARRLNLVEQRFAENDELLGLLQQNIGRVEHNRYNLEVYLSIARLCRQNLEMLRDISRMDAMIAAAHQAATANQAEKAVASLDEVIDAARDIQKERNIALKDATETWYKSWQPRIAEGNGRTFLHEMDDVKDHLPDRTVGMEYLVYRELILPFGKWVDQVQTARNAYAKAHQMGERKESFDWGNTDAAQ